MPQTLRTFVAVEIAAETHARAGQLIGRLQAASPDVKWVEPRNLHWSLQFLGEVDVREIPQVCDAVTRAVADVPQFDLEAHGAGAFPDLHRPRTLWLGAAAGSEEMAALHERIAASLAPLGFRQEQRRFRPHLTLGRVRGGPHAELTALLEQHRDFAAGITEVEEVVVFSCDLSRGGPTYDVLATAELAR